MKKFMLRGHEKKAISARHMPNRLEYGVWYDFISPFDSHYFKISRNSRYVMFYDFIHDESPDFIVSRKRFIKEIIKWAKAPPRKVNIEEYNGIFNIQ